MRIVQIIDSLEIGGAERMAVNYANALSEKIEFSGLISTRREGVLLEQIRQEVSYLFLNRTKSFDINAVFRLRKFIKKNKVEVIHAHSSSFFIAVLVKLTLFKIKIVWHDHYGSRIKQSKKQNRVLVYFSIFFASIFSVNRQLAAWSLENLRCKNVVFIPNFILKKDQNQNQNTYLKGTEGRRIVFLANLKEPKNHISILKAFTALKLYENDWSLHLIGKDYLDLYSSSLKEFIKLHNLESHVFLYGSKSDINFILQQASIGVLASIFEGFPVTLIEYGCAGLPVLSTNAGYCSEIIKNEETGLLFDPLNEQEIILQMQKIINNNELRNKFANHLKQVVENIYNEDKIIETILLEYSKIIK
ncbi:glycosyltransferase [Flavobacterium hungaricum]|uniref:Glycosyltransferase n=1 Tax=Flavobacterium hungaricum TaxID=2082725 RepID=A0ABR9TS00_9FLAO|nr:glycosyltransferase [Flavobacterium hungaricum]MBE8727797.1 glycosyltransferase [Flavobacterium hungaricum]